MKITDRQIGLLALIVGAGAFWYGYFASKTEQRNNCSH